MESDLSRLIIIPRWMMVYYYPSLEKKVQIERELFNTPIQQ